MEFIERMVACLSRNFGPVYAKDAFAFGFPLVPFFEKKIVTVGYDERIHPWLLTLDGNIDLHLNGTMIISVRECDAAMVAEVTQPEISCYSEKLRTFDPEEALWLSVIINQITDKAGLGDRC